MNNATFLSKLKVVEFWHGEGAARKLAAAKYLREHAALIRDNKWVEMLPGYHHFLEDVAELASKARLPAPEVKVMMYHGDKSSMAAMLSDEIMLVSETSFFRFTRNELRAVAGHELGHIHQGDAVRAPSIIPRRKHRQEYDADRFPAQITGDPGSLASAIKKFSEGGNLKGNSSHPNPVSRINFLDGLSKGQSEGFVERLGRNAEKIAENGKC